MRDAAAKLGKAASLLGEAADRAEADAAGVVDMRHSAHYGPP